eukprot:GHVP01037567.1.p1 GENE.GHVP01037567.1~~GHVP01037567.1.p1  ORF type:complete len:296 (+),score=57.46 GHVP01037567.1:177-1064(+)
MPLKVLIVKTGQKISLCNLNEPNGKMKMGKGPGINNSKLFELEKGVEYSYSRTGVLKKKEDEEIFETSKEFKTEMAKKKYLRKLDERNNRNFTVLKPTPYRLTEYYVSKGRGLGIEALSWILRQGGVNSKGRYLVCEDIGIISGSIMFRTEGKAETKCVYTTARPFGNNILADKFEERNFTYGELNLTGSIEGLKQEYFDSLFICLCEDNLEKLKVFTGLSQYLVLCGCLVVHSKYRESLFELYMHLRESKEYIDVILVESTTREYKNVGNITNPEIYGRGDFSYVLSAKKVLLE